MPRQSVNLSRMKASARSAALLSALALLLALGGLGRSGHPPRSRSTRARPTPTSRASRRSSWSTRSSRITRSTTELAGKLLDRYLDALDGTRSLFLQSDVDEFARVPRDAAQATRATGDTSAAHAIFARYLERLEQQARYVTEQLQDGEVRLHRARHLLVRSRARAAAARPGGGARRSGGSSSAPSTCRRSWATSRRTQIVDDADAAARAAAARR